ncbi:uncharacterized protein LOC142017706 [Carettochelys insculpta]|uniref:uncharacterized protein LOC142017706 n=1 Tax=Carettochelys insculpta TaxID=44489 RepID=UPI003EB7E008
MLKAASVRGLRRPGLPSPQAGGGRDRHVPQVRRRGDRDSSRKALGGPPVSIAPPVCLAVLPSRLGELRCAPGIARSPRYSRLFPSLLRQAGGALLCCLLTRGRKAASWTTALPPAWRALRVAVRGCREGDSGDFSCARSRWGPRVAHCTARSVSHWIGSTSALPKKIPAPPPLRSEAPAPLPLRSQSAREKFLVLTSTEHSPWQYVVCVLNAFLLQRVIRVGDLDVAVAGFAALGFPNCFGALDGAHIPIDAPDHSGGTIHKPEGLPLHGPAGHGGEPGLLPGCLRGLAWLYTRSLCLPELRPVPLAGGGDLYPPEGDPSGGHHHAPLPRGR